MKILVVGQGLAGTLASHAALVRGWDVHVIDAGLPSASAVAAGMFNPMSFRRIVEVWEAEAHLRAMHATYADLESRLKLRLVHPLPIHKRFANDEYREAWARKASELDWLDPMSADGSKVSHGVVNGGGWVNVPALLSGWRHQLAQAQRFTQRPLKSQDYADYHAGKWDAVIDCRGTGITQDPQLPRLDIRSNRGELITVRPQEAPIGLPTGSILNFGKWTIPLEGGRWRLGASYEWNRNDLEPTQSTRLDLLEQLAVAVPALGPVAVEEHQVGIRPVSRDRRPAVGALPGPWNRWFVLNGLGTRGVLIGPRWASQLIQIIGKASEADPVTQASRLILKHT